MNTQGCGDLLKVLIIDNVSDLGIAIATRNDFSSEPLERITLIEGPPSVYFSITGLDEIVILDYPTHFEVTNYQLEGSDVIIISLTQEGIALLGLVDYGTLFFTLQMEVDIADGFEEWDIDEFLDWNQRATFFINYFPPYPH